MVNLSFPVARNDRLPSERQRAESTTGTSSMVADLDGGDLLAPARGAVNGVLLGLPIWGLIAVGWWVL